MLNRANHTEKISGHFDFFIDFNVCFTLIFALQTKTMQGRVLKLHLDLLNKMRS